MTKTGQYQRCISAIHWLETSGVLAIVIFVLAVIGTPVVQAQTYTVLYQFKGSPTDGSGPSGGVIRDSAGNLYGTTSAGGASCTEYPTCGVVFKLDMTGTETVVHSFTGADGEAPSAGLIRDSAGNLYGTTQGGGASGYAGVVFKLDPTGTETLLHSFTGADGETPVGRLIRDSAGNLYGTTYSGGAHHHGVVFKLDPTGTETVLHSFTGGAGGDLPEAGLARDSAGNFYGTTICGGIFPGSDGFGVVFKLGPAGKETVLYSFTGGADGAYPGDPGAGVIRDSAGNLYGTTGSGGITTGACGALGCGVVFKLDTTGKETVLYSFTGGADGRNPYAGVIRDSAGNLYGTTPGGGASGNGVVFKLDTTGKETVLYSFTGGADGGNPGTLVRDSAGNLYGTTFNGGTANSPQGNGVVFKLKP